MRAHRHQGPVPGAGFRAGLILLAAIGVAAWPKAVAAQSIGGYFPSGVSGYDQQLGVTVLSRLHPLYDTPGVRAGGFVISPSLEEALNYNSNVNGVAGSGSWGTRTTGQIAAASDWTRNSLAGSVGFTHNQFFSFPEEDYTDWNVGIGGGYTIADSMLNAAYSHQNTHQLGTGIGTLQSETPALETTDTAHLDYTFNFNRLAVTPDFNVSAYRFGMATVLGVPVNQQFLNRNVVAGGLTGRYSLSEEGGLLVVVHGESTNYIQPQPGQPSNNSNSVLLLAGIDYQAAGVWRYRLLVGVEVRAFEAPQYGTRAAPLIEGSVIWTPTGLTTVTGTLSRQIMDTESAGSNGFVLTQANFNVDHELMRNVFLQGRGGAEFAQYLQGSGGTQTSLTVGASINWLINRNLRLSLDYDFTKQTGNSSSASPTNPTTFTAAPSTQSLAALTLHLAL